MTTTPSISRAAAHHDCKRFTRVGHRAMGRTRHRLSTPEAVEFSLRPNFNHQRQGPPTPSYPERHRKGAGYVRCDVHPAVGKRRSTPRGSTQGRKTRAAAQARDSTVVGGHGSACGTTESTARTDGCSRDARTWEPSQPRRRDHPASPTKPSPVPAATAENPPHAPSPPVSNRASKLTASKQLDAVGMALPAIPGHRLATAAVAAPPAVPSPDSPAACRGGAAAGAPSSAIDPRSSGRHGRGGRPP